MYEQRTTVDEDDFLSKTNRLHCHSWQRICDNGEFRNYIFKARTVQLGSGPQALEEYSSLLRSNYATLTSSYHHPWMRKHGDDPWSWCADRAHECPSSDGDPCEGAHASFAQCPQASKRKTVSVERQLTVLQLGMLAGFWQNLKLPCE